MLNYIFSEDTVTLIIRGKPYSQPRTDELVEAIRTNDLAAVEAIVFPKTTQNVVETMTSLGAVEVFNGHITIGGRTVHGFLVDRILETNALGLPIAPMAAFLQRVDRNPDGRARDDLFAWIEKSKMPILPDGRFLAYRLIRQDWKDIYTGTIDNSIGATPFMDRNLCDSDPDRTCSRGLHFCNAVYLPNYGSSDSRVVIVAIDPADVVAFPRDYGLSKGRCCRYEVLEEVPRETAAEFFANSPFVYSQEDFDQIDETGAQDDLTVAERAFVENFDVAKFS